MRKKGEGKEKFVEAVLCFKVPWSADGVARMMGIEKKRVNDYILKARQQGLLDMKDGLYFPVPGTDIMTLNMSSKLYQKPSTAADLPSVKERLVSKINDLVEYVKFLEEELLKERRDHTDLRDWVDRTLRKVPPAENFRISMPG